MQTKLFALASLALAPENARFDSEPDFSDLLASIPVAGLLDPLHGYEEAGTAYIEDGGRRLLALRHLAGTKQGRKVLSKWALDLGVPVIIRDREGARLRSAVTFVRAGLHPADEILQVKACMEEGQHNASEIGAALALPERKVRQYQRLVNVAPDILAAFKAKRLSLDAVQAFSLSDDQAQQRTVFEALGDNCAPYSVKSRLQADGLSPNSNLGRFVGREDYAAAGGGFLVDLFNHGDEDAGWTDAGLALRLADAKLEQIADEVRAEGWANVVVVRPGEAWSEGMTRSDPVELGLSEEDETAYQEAMETLETEDLEPEDYETADAVIERLDAARFSWPDEVKAAGVAYVMIGHNGARIERGWIAREGSRPFEAAPVEPVQTEPKAADLLTGWTHGGHKTLTTVATLATRYALLANPAAAGDVLLAHLLVATLHHGAGAITYRANGAALFGDGVDMGALDEPFVEAWDKAKVEVPSDFAGALAYVGGLKPKAKADLTALCVGASLDAVEEGFHHYQRKRTSWDQLGCIARHLGVKFGAVWNPAAAFLAKGDRAALEATAESLGLNPAKYGRKSDLAEAVAREAERRSWTPKLLADLTGETADAAPEPVDAPASPAADAHAAI